MLIDLHTHQRIKAPGTLSIYNLILRDDIAFDLPDSAFTTGIHPWYLPIDFASSLSKLESAIESPNCLAIGECGLDRAIATPQSHQEAVFFPQVELAARRNKPLILHCVKAYSEMIRIRKNLRNAPPWILHSFNGNEKELKELIRNDFYFSVVLSENRSSIRADLLQKIPADRLFLETDNSRLNIGAVYEKATNILGVSNDKLVKQIHLNYVKIFG